MTTDLKGWQPDPFGVHELRFFSDDGRPTRLVSDNNFKAYDEPPAERATATASAADEPEGSDGPGAARGAGVGELVSHDLSSGSAAGWFPDPKEPRQQRYWNGLGWTDHTSASGSFLTENTREKGARPSLLLRSAVMVAAVLLVAGVIGLVTVARSPKTGSNPPVTSAASGGADAQATGTSETDTIPPSSTTTTTLPQDAIAPLSSVVPVPRALPTNATATATGAATDPTLPSIPSASTTPSTAPLPTATPSTTTTTLESTVAAWYATNGQDLQQLQNDVAAFDDLPLGPGSETALIRTTCTSLATDAASAAAALAIPDASIEPMWTTATTDLRTGTQECIQSIGADEPTVWDAAEVAIDAGAADLTSVVSRVEAEVDT